MAFKLYLVDLATSFVQFLRRAHQLVFSPYKVMRIIYFDGSLKEVVFIFASIGIYFYLADHLRGYLVEPHVLFFFTIIHFFLTIAFFALFQCAIFSIKEFRFKPYILLFSYSLIPTLVWFLVNSLLYAIIPPPRTESIYGQIFSIFFISFSISILFWKFILLYLAIRYSTKMKFFSIMYSMLLYVAIVVPYAVFLYYLRLFRIPFL